MAANEPCVEDLIPKNRQNNVYGHGEVRALDALLEAAQYHFDFNSNLSVTVSTPTTLDNRIHLRDWDSIVFDVSENTETVRWRSNGLETPWTTLHGYEPGDSSAEISVISIIHYLEHESVEIIGNHTIMIRGILDEDGANPQSSPIITAEIMVMTDDKSPPMPADEDGFSTYAVIGFSLGGIILFLIVLLLVSTLSTREEGSLSGKQLRTYLDAQIVDAVDADLSDNPFWEEKA
tara:strand:- start:276 stop:977 length:702 start_codon:yes stop_codon:yes gene_type:complete